MASPLTIRSVPDDVKSALTHEAQHAGQSLQAYLLGILTRQAAFSGNRELIDELEHGHAAGAGAGADAPDAAAVLRQERARGDAPASRGGAS